MGREYKGYDSYEIYIEVEAEEILDIKDRLTSDMSDDEIKYVFWDYITSDGDEISDHDFSVVWPMALKLHKGV